jgi:acetoin utilization protein AcuB
MTRVRDLMTCTVRTVPPDLDTAAARHLMRMARIHHLVVVKDDRIVGVLSQRDLGGTRDEALPVGRVDGVMRSNVVAIAPEVTLRAAATMLRGYDIGCLPVVDGKQLVGILTTSDLLRWIAGDRPANGRRTPKSSAGRIRA